MNTIGGSSLTAKEMILFPTHDPVVGYFLGRMMVPNPNGGLPSVMIRGTMDASDFSMSALWNEGGLEIEGGLTEGKKTEDFLSILTPKLVVNPYSGFWGAAKDMQVKSTMQIKESVGT